jgi:hypothetical protein
VASTAHSVEAQLRSAPARPSRIAERGPRNWGDHSGIKPGLSTGISQSAQNAKLDGRNQRRIKGVIQEIPQSFEMADARPKLVSRLARLIRRHPIASNRLVWAALAGTLVWFADQPTVDGYNPLVEMFWNPGFSNIPNWDRAVLLLSWLITTLFCHFLLFAFQKVRPRKPQS